MRGLRLLVMIPRYGGFAPGAPPSHLPGLGLVGCGDTPDQWSWLTQGRPRPQWGCHEPLAAALTAPVCGRDRGLRARTQDGYVRA